MTEEEKRNILRKKLGIPFFIFLLLQYFIFMIFPKQLSGNIYVIIVYLIICLGFLLYYNNFKRKLK